MQASLRPSVLVMERSVDWAVSHTKSREDGINTLRSTKLVSESPRGLYLHPLQPDCTNTGGLPSFTGLEAREAFTIKPN